MKFLLSQVLCGYDATFLERMLQDGWACYFAFLTFMILASFTLMNMLIGILCTVVSGAYDEAQGENWQTELEAKADLTMERLNVQKTGRFSLMELDRIIQNPGDFWELHNLGVDLVTLWNAA